MTRSLSTNQKATWLCCLTSILFLGDRVNAGVVFQIDFGDAFAVGSPGGNWVEVPFATIDTNGDGFVSNLTDYVTGNATTVQMTLDEFASAGAEGENWTDTDWVVSQAADDAFQPLPGGAVIIFDGLEAASTYKVEVVATFYSTSFPPDVFDPTDFEVNGAFTNTQYDPANTSVTAPASDDWNLSASHNEGGVNDWMIWNGMTAEFGRITIDVTPEAGTFGTFGAISAVRIEEIEPIPEPEIAVLFLSALIGFCIRRRRAG